MSFTAPCERIVTTIKVKGTFPRSFFSVRRRNWAKVSNFLKRKSQHRVVEIGYCESARVSQKKIKFQKSSSTGIFVFDGIYKAPESGSQLDLKAPYLP